ncbi:adhesion G-protein coupled receptor F1-like [Salmo salar]|uniref:Adhesion G-protein coupled receptor F1-like n=1 Tax=Salmo salar TaxID=8030 RepID=A0ABM3EWP4_SALSA|nr:adhesion G-protein coupled receptor F1-like [Salmo salar]
MKNFLDTAGVLTSNAAKASWGVLNTDPNKNESSPFLGTVETISNFLTDDFFDIETAIIFFNKTTVNNLFNLNSSVLIDIPASEASFSSITIITFESLENVLPAKNSSSLNNRVNTINRKVVLVKGNGTIKNVTFSFDVLNADIWFIIGAAISENEEKDLPACSTATFFIHFFYLALFIWMLVSGLLLLYRTVMVFSHMSKPAMLAISFSLGYGAPLIIAVITITVTAPGKQYIRGIDGAFVIPALTIVVINLLILIVVLFKMLRRGVGDVTQPDERNALVVIARCLAILTPFFGTTWGLRVGTMTTPNNLGIHIVFAIFNSLQGLFILVFGTLLDKKIREALTGRSQVSSNRTRELYYL